MRTKSSTIMLEACTFYFVKLITKFTEWSDYLKCTIERKNGSYWHNVEKTNLFWVLPGIKMFHFALSTSILNCLLYLYAVYHIVIFNYYVSIL